MNDKLAGMIGLAMRAGKLVIGTEQVCLSMAKGKVLLCLASSEASEGTRKKLRTKCEFYGVRMITHDIRIGELGRIVGKTYAPACIGVTDVNFADAIAKLAGLA